MNNDEKILETLGALQAGQARLEKNQERLEQNQTQTNTTLGHVSTAIESVKAGQDDLREHLKAGFMDLGVKIDRTARDNKRLIEELE